MKMRKSLILVMAVLLLTGCGDSTSGGETSTDIGTASTEVIKADTADDTVETENSAAQGEAEYIGTFGEDVFFTGIDKYVGCEFDITMIYEAKDMEDISLYLPVDDLDKLYNPRVTDEIKSHFDLNNYCEDSSAFFDVWKRLFFRYPKEYIISFINLNLPYWYPDSDSVDAISQRAYIETNIYPVEVSGYEVIRNSKIPFLLDFYEKFASYELCRSIPVISNLFSISTPIWIMLLTVLILAIKRKLRLALVFLPVLIYWCTFLLGPVSNFRYIFPIMVLYPLFIILMLQTNKLEDINI